MLIFGITKLINRALAPKLLSWGLKLDVNLPSSLSRLALLPLAQRLVSIEVRDDYRRLGRQSQSIGGGGIGSGGGGARGGAYDESKAAWDDFVDVVWNSFVGGGGVNDGEADARRSHGGGRSRGRGRGRGERRTSIEMQGGRRVRLLGGYVLPALLSSSSLSSPSSSSAAAPAPASLSHATAYRHSRNDRFVRWIRAEYLIARYGPAVQRAIAEHPVLRRLDDRDDCDGILDDLNHLLPSVDVVRRAFDAEDWSRCKPPPSSWADDRGGRTTDGNDNDRNDGDVQDDDDDDLEFVIHNRLRGHVAHSGPLNAYFEMRGRDDSYELWTREYVRGLAQYLLGRIDEMNDRDDDGDVRGGGRRRKKRTTVLDVGAGDGRLAHFLRLAMREIAGGGGALSKPTKEGKKKRKRARNSLHQRDEGTPNDGLPDIVATDDGSWRAPIYDKENAVERLSVIESLETYRPRGVSTTATTTTMTTASKTTTEDSRLIVLCSWMPPGQDWTAAFRRPIADVDDGRDRDGTARLVEEYILIGEADDGTCGHNWLTWGNPDFRDRVSKPDDDDDGDVDGDEAPPYALDGYVRRDLEELSMLQFSRFDCKRSRESKTVSFRRHVAGHA
jgi:hypothetical protein